MYFKSTTINKSELEAAYNAGKSLCLLCGNNSVNQINDSGTVLWYGSSNKPSYLYNKQWCVPRTTDIGPGSTLADIIQFMTDKGLTSLTFTVKNENVDVIVSTGTNSGLVGGGMYFDMWGEPQPGELGCEDEEKET